MNSTLAKINAVLFLLYASIPIIFAYKDGWFNSENIIGILLAIVILFITLLPLFLSFKYFRIIARQANLVVSSSILTILVISLIALFISLIAMPEVLGVATMKIYQNTFLELVLLYSTSVILGLIIIIDLIILIRQSYEYFLKTKYFWLSFAPLVSAIIIGIWLILIS